MSTINRCRLDGQFSLRWNETGALWFAIRAERLYNTEKKPDRTGVNPAALLGRILFVLEERMEYALSEMESTSEEESLSPAAELRIGIAEENAPLLTAAMAELERQLREEYRDQEGELRLTVREEGAGVLPGLHPVDLQKTVFYLLQLPEGPQNLGGTLPCREDLSCFAERVLLLPDGLHVRLSLEGRTISQMEMLEKKICYLTEFLGGEMNHGYPVME